LGGGQEGLVLSDSSPWMPTHRPAAAGADCFASASTNADLATSAAHCATKARRPVQLRRWLRELASRLVGSQEGVVLQGPRQGLPKSGRRWMRHFVGAIRLQCRFR